MAPICPHCEKEIDVPEIVEVDPDQTLPKNPYMRATFLVPRGFYPYKEAQETMVREGWRKVR